MRPAPCSILVVAAAIFSAPAHASVTIFLDRCADGCTYTPGFDDSRTDTSSLVGSIRTVSAFAHGDESWDAVVGCVQEAFAPFDAVVTEIDPEGVDHLEIAVAGASSELGLPAGIGSISPVTCEGDRVVANGIGFAFADTFGNVPLEICWNAAQAAGALLGLDLVLVEGDVMTILAGSLPKQFLDEPGSCGESTPRACRCGGTTQNSYQSLLATLPEPAALVSALAALAGLLAVARLR